ncbi:MAG: hypothetical protein LBJ72_09300 [Dysgonamonadaceae bacterium]|nr:hypothetical protein [Dysgonamonadaceae bacterium]
MAKSMKQDYYFVSGDGSIMDLEDFLSYIGFLKTYNVDFVFDEWFSKEDFSTEEAYNLIKKMVSI